MSLRKIGGGLSLTIIAGKALCALGMHDQTVTGEMWHGNAYKRIRQCSRCGHSIEGWVAATYTRPQVKKEDGRTTAALKHRRSRRKR